VAALVGIAGALICLAALVLPTALAVVVAVLVGALYLALPRLVAPRAHGVAP
jgi:chromate transport protein ChrA